MLEKQLRGLCKDFALSIGDPFRRADITQCVPRVFYSLSSAAPARRTAHAECINTANNRSTNQ